MKDNYAKILRNNLDRLYGGLPDDLAENFPAQQDGKRFIKEFPDSMPYVGAFATHSGHLLIPHSGKIKEAVPTITRTLKGEKAPIEAGGDFSFIVYPLPKIALCYIYYEADGDFPPSVTCLYSNNANQFLPIDGLADEGEYTSRKILDMIS